MCKSPIYIVTGTTGGIGTEIAESIAAERKPLVLACRNMEKAEKQCLSLKEKYGYDDIYAAKLELETFSDVMNFCNEIKAMKRQVAALVNNAGLMARNSELSKIGFEKDYQVNVFSTALLTLLLVPSMTEGANVVFTTSVTRDIWKLPECFPQENKFGQLSTYGRSKRALTMFAGIFAEKMKSAGIRVNCADPGVVDSGMITMHRWFDPLADVFFRPLISSPRKGASSAINAMKSDKTGMIFFHDKVKSPSKSITKNAQKIYDIIIQILRDYL